VTSRSFRGTVTYFWESCEGGVRLVFDGVVGLLVVSFGFEGACDGLDSKALITTGSMRVVPASF